MKELAGILPQKPGVYKFLDKNGVVIYIGKAKNLKKRVQSYFVEKSIQNHKTKLLVNKVRSVEHIVVSTETDALLLENNLIKEVQPKYNILLKDDKSFPWIVIKNEYFPRVFYTRNIIKDGSEYFGPYTSVLMVKSVLNLIHNVFKLRTCKLLLQPDKIKNNEFKVCLQYHLGNCQAPCVGYIDSETYSNQINEIKDIVRGNMSKVKVRFKELMYIKANELKFEEAEELKNSIKLLDNYQSKSTIVNPKLDNLEVYGFEKEDNYAFVNILVVKNGAIVQSHTVEIKKQLDEPDEEILQYAISDLRKRLNTRSKQIIVPFNFDSFLNEVDIVIPQIGDKRKLLDLSQRNAKYYRLEKNKRIAQSDKSNKIGLLLETAQRELKLQKLPRHIECFDNSNIQGTNPVAACVVFRNGKSRSSEYRHYHIKTVKGPDDFASMYEVVHRRYKRLLNENKSLPDLLIVDGGKGQLNAALKALSDLSIVDKLPLIGIAKRLEEIYFPGDPVPLYIDKNSNTLKLIQNMRNEAHRFGINFHRDIRSKNMLNHNIEALPTIGPKTIDVLIKHFGAIRNIDEKQYNKLESLIGESKAKIIIDFLRENVNSN